MKNWEYGLDRKSIFFRTTDYQQEIRTNKLGTVNFQESFKKYDKLIFAIGDSYTQGIGLASDAGYPFQLDLLLNAGDSLYTPQYGIVNLGLASYGGKQAVISLRRFSLKIGKPDFILYLGCKNDADDDRLFANGYYHKQLVEGSPHWGAFLKPIQWMTNNLELGKRLKIVIGNIRRKESSKKSGGKPKPVVASQEPALIQIQQFADSIGSKMIISWANAFDEEDGSYIRLKNWSQKQHIAFADWRNMAMAVKHNIPELPLTNNHSGGHYRTWVNHIIANAYRKEIIGYEKDKSILQE